MWYVTYENFVIFRAASVIKRPLINGPNLRNSNNPIFLAAWSPLKNFTILREGYAFQTPSIGRRFNFLTRMAVGKFRNFQKLEIFSFYKLCMYLYYFYLFQDREFWRISRNCSRNQPPQKYPISPWVFGFCQIIFWKRQK